MMIPDTGAGAASLLRSLRRRHEPTWAHGRRVCAAATALGMQLAVDGDALRDLRYAALLHDVGKLAFPEEILVSSAPLSGLETAFVRAHPRIGYEMLRRVPGLQRAAEIVYASHERIDGRGYPRGLKGLEIPPAARILAVADAADVLVEGRPYQSAVTMDEAGAILAASAGLQFDSDVVRAWFRMIDRTSDPRVSVVSGLVGAFAED